MTKGVTLMRFNKIILLTILILMPITSSLRSLREETEQTLSIGTGIGITIGSYCLLELLENKIHPHLNNPYIKTAISLLIGALVGQCTHGYFSTKTEEWHQEKQHEDMFNALAEIETTYERIRQSTTLIPKNLPLTNDEIETFIATTYQSDYPLITAHLKARSWLSQLTEYDMSIKKTNRKINLLIKLSTFQKHENFDACKRELLQFKQQYAVKQDSIKKQINTIQDYVWLIMQNEKYSSQLDQYDIQQKITEQNNLDQQLEQGKNTLYKNEEYIELTHQQRIAGIYRKTIESETQTLKQEYEREKTHLTSNIDDLYIEMRRKQKQINILQNTIINLG